MASPRRPGTIARTNKRRRFLDVAPSSPSSSSSTLVPSTRLSTLRQESHGDPVVVLNRLLNTLRENEVPGPQFFRLHREFTTPLGEGGQGNVRGINDISANKYLKANGRIASKWPVDLIAIKQYQRKTVTSQSDIYYSHAHKTVEPSQHGLDARFRATEAEVLALSPSLFRRHPNIVQLMGWGLCLDTIENPKSPCCGSLQTPLLILERAEMNLSQFIRRLLPDASHPETLAEEGYSTTETYVARHSGSLSQTEILSTAWGVPLWWMGLEMSPFGLIQQLCLDIGHGLQSLHEHKFTHGDLKPENVLIFKSGSGWCAKLCDFGCARGEFNEHQDTSEDGKVVDVVKEQYLGTETWLPPKEEIASSHDFEGLRKCDLFVYGLVVWSAFCLRGSSPPPNPRLEDARADLQRLGAEGGIFPFTRARLANRILNVLERTMKEHGSRNDPAPWKHLAHRRKSTRKLCESNTTESAVGISWAFYVLMNWLRTTWLFFKLMYSLPWRPSTRKFVARIQDPFNTRHVMETGAPVALSSTIKAKYNRKSWWQQEIITDSTAATSFFFSAINSRIAAEPHSTQMQASEDEGYGPASSTVLSSDDNSLSMALFESKRRRSDAKRHPAKMLENIQQLSRRPPRGSLPDLYYDARFRSRIRYEWWVQDAPQKNILEEALQLFPPIDIGTLAWLCNGVVGKYEVQNLPANDAIWRFIISPISSRTKLFTLNESERLDRFLLLLQFGARVEQTLTVGSALRYFAKDSDFHETPETIFSAFICNCRPATISVVLREVYRRFEEVKFKDHIAKSTRSYMTGNSSTTLSDSSQAKADITIEGVREVLHGDWYPVGASNRTTRPSKSEQSWFGRILKGLLLSIKKTFYRAGFQGTTQGHTARPSASEQTPLLRMPQGWKAAPNQLYFEEEFSQSFTLTRPKMSLIGKRQIEVGFLDKGPANVCHVDLTSCMPPSTDVITIEALESRFPSYDDDWFAMEWTTETSRKDVLGDIRDPWPLRTFAIRVTVPAYMTSILDWLKAIAAWTVLIALFGGIAIGLIIAFWLAAKRLEEHYEDIIHQMS